MTSESRCHAFTLVPMVLVALVAAPGLAAAQASSRPLVAARLAQMFQQADVDGDGLSDVIVADFLGDEVRVIVNRGNGELGETNRLSPGRGPRGVVVADFNRDGWLDVAVSNFLSGDIAVFLGEGNARFSAPRRVNVGVGVNAMAGADFTGDGQVDLTVANFISGEVILLRGQSDGSFDDQELVGHAPATSLLALQTTSIGSLQLLAVDVKGERATRFVASGEGLVAAGEESIASGGPADWRAANGEGPGLRRVSGDGQAKRIEEGAPEPFVIEIRSPDGGVSTGEQVTFFELARGFDHHRTVSLPSDAQGQTGAAVGPSALSENHIVAAARSTGELTLFGATSTMSSGDLMALVHLAMAGSPLGADAHARLQRFTAVMERELSNRNEAGAVAALARSLAVLEDEAKTTSSPSNAALNDVLRRIVNQLLVVGSEGVTPSTEVTCGVPVAGSIDAADEVDTFTFNVVDGERLEISAVKVSGDASFAPVWRLLDETGAPVAGCGTFTSSARDCGPLPASGNPYVIEVVDNNRFDTGTYSVNLERLTAAARCANATLTCGAPQAADIEVVADTDIFAFSVAEGERLEISAVKVSGHSFFAPVWRLLDATGAAVPGCGTYSSSARDCGPLPASGNPYAIEVVASSRFYTGTYSVNLERLTAAARCANATLTCGAPQAADIETVADTDVFAFSVAEGERVEIAAPKVSGHSFFGPVWRLLNATGAPVAGCGTYSSSARDCGPLPASGNPYALEVVDANRFYTGTYSVNLERLTTGARCPNAALTCGVPVPGEIEAVGDTDVFGYTTTTDGTIRIAVTKTSGHAFFGPAWRLLDSTGAGTATCGGFGGTRTCSVPAAGSPYAIEVADSSRFYTGTYSVLVDQCSTPPPPGPDLVVTAVSNPPATAVLGSKITVTDTTNNQGGASAVATKNRYYFSSDQIKSANDKRLGGARNVPGLGAGASHAGSKAVTVPKSMRTGVYFLIACADDTKLVNEGTNENNNCLASATTIEIKAPDLVVSAVSDPPAAASPGSSFAATDTVHNGGNADAAQSSTNGYFLSLDTKKSGSDIALTGTRTVGPLNIGGNSTGNAALTVPPGTASNSYYLIACADAANKVAEGNASNTGEKNNCRASATKVTISP
jgi:FG-GAP-like repeat/CARDB